MKTILLLLAGMFMLVELLIMIFLFPLAMLYNCIEYAEEKVQVLRKGDSV